MARHIKGRLFTRGKNKHYYLQYYVNGKEIKKVLHDENGGNITSKIKAQKAADKLLAPYLAKDEVQRREQAKAALQSAEEKAAELEKIQNAILLKDAYDLAIKKPRRRKISEKSLRDKKNHWYDFCCFMTAKFSEIKTLDKVTPKHAEKYTQYLIENGKYNKKISFNRKNRTSTYEAPNTLLSPRSINAYLISVNEIFNLLALDGGYSVSPFAHIPKQKLIQDKREAFTMEELALIAEDADEFILPLFTVGLCTGLREADICLLEWREVNMNENIIIRKTRKTGKEVTIPIMPPLKIFLGEKYKKTGNDKYVLPEHADMYLNNPSGISWRVKKKLEQLGVETTRIPEGRSRAVSVKDVHSLRHSFCYYAGLFNVPLAIVQSVVGHMSPDMTKYYSMHATKNDIKNAFEKISGVFGVINAPSVKKLPITINNESERNKLHKLIDTFPIEKIRDILQQLTSEK
jgi:integrase